MAAKTVHISLTPELKASIDARVRSGLYDDANDVVRAGLRALTREETAASFQAFQKIMSKLPQEPITSQMEVEIVETVRQARATEDQKGRQ